ncbi:MAG: hypothetical protein K2W85_05930 [Phycisphaerales bacterium]|nr:hypothetical protein [Phycisphaerales bacterium]
MNARRSIPIVCVAMVLVWLARVPASIAQTADVAAVDREFRELWALATAPPEKRPAIYVFAKQWMGTARTPDELRRMEEEAARAPEGAKAMNLASIKRMIGLDGPPTEIRTWAASDLWRISVEAPNFPNVSPGGNDTAQSSSVLWQQSSGRLMRIRRSMTPPPMYDARGMYSSWGPFAWSVFTGGLSQLHFAEFESPPHLSRNSDGRLTTTTSGTMRSQAVRLDIEIQTDPSSGLISRIDSRVTRIDDNRFIQSASAQDWGTLPNITDRRVPRLIMQMGTDLVIKYVLEEAKIVSDAEVRSLVEPPDWEKPDVIRPDLKLIYIQDMQPDGTLLQNNADGTQVRGGGQSAGASKTLRMTGWWFITVIIATTLVVVAWRFRKH